MNEKLKELGFIESEEAEGIIRCCTIPCFGDKMPHQRQPVVPCAIMRTMCDESPYFIMKCIRHNEEKIRIAEQKENEERKQTKQVKLRSENEV